jgi:hypothetical protein
VNIIGQVFASDGTKRGGEFVVNGNSNNRNFNYAVSMNDSGQFCVAWGALHGIAKPAESNSATYAKCYNADGTVRLSEFTVDDSTDSWVEPSVAVAMDNSGGFIVAYGQEVGYTTGIKARRFSSTLIGGQSYWVDKDSYTRRDNLNIAMSRTTGNYVVVAETDNAYTGVRATLVANDIVIKSTWQINNISGVSEDEPSVAMSNDGYFAIAWRTDMKPTGATSKQSVVLYQTFDNVGTSLNSPTFIFDELDSSQSAPSVAINTNGGDKYISFVWGARGYSAKMKYNGVDVLYTTIDFYTGKMMVSPQIINSYKDSTQQSPTIGSSQSSLIAGWEDHKQEGGSATSAKGVGIYGVRLK